MFFSLFNKLMKVQKNTIEVIEGKSKYLIPFPKDIENLDLKELKEVIKSVYPNIEHIKMKDIEICSYNKYWTKNDKNQLVTCVINEKTRKDIQDLGLVLNPIKEFGATYISKQTTFNVNNNVYILYLTFDIDKDILFGNKRPKQKAEWRYYNPNTKQEVRLPFPYNKSEKNIIKYIKKELEK